MWRSKTRTTDRDGRAPAVFDLRPGGRLSPKTHRQDDSAEGPYTEAHRCGAGGDLGGAVRRVVSMRTKLTGALVAIALPFFLGACSVFGGKAAEEPAYGILLADSDIEIREYDGHAIAWTAAAGPFDEAVGAGFRRLFEYITGANAGGSDIAMTAPVLTTPAMVNTGTTVLEPNLGADDGESPEALAGIASAAGGSASSCRTGTRPRRRRCRRTAALRSGTWARAVSRASASAAGWTTRRARRSGSGLSAGSKRAIWSTRGTGVWRATTRPGRSRCSAGTRSW